MNATLELHYPKPSLFKLTAAIVMASAITFALFVMMQKLIAFDGEDLTQPRLSPIIELTSDFKENRKSVQ